MQELVVYAAKSKKVMYSITFVILPVTKTIFCTRGCFSASLGLKMNIDSLSWPYGHLRLSNLSFPALVTLENNHSYQKLFPTLGKWQMNEVKYYSLSNLKTTQIMAINKELDSTNLPPLPPDLSRQGPLYSLPTIFNTYRKLAPNSIIDDVTVLEDVFLTVTGYSFWDRLRNFLHKFTWIVLSFHKLNKVGKFW